MTRLPDPVRAHWRDTARRWHLVGPPLRPPPEDVAVYRGAVVAWDESGRGRAPRALLLGVTPELVSMDWPAGSQVLAADLSPEMIRGVWPGPRAGHRAVCAEWTRLPLPDADRDVILGDGVFNVLSGGVRFAPLCASLRRVIRGGGLLVLRFFVRPERPEPLSQVFADLRAGRIASFHLFKWRLAMAAQRDLCEGVRLAEVWDAWHADAPDGAAVVRGLGWPAQVLATLDGFRERQARLTFPTLAEARAALADGFREQALHVPGYEMGERFPILVLRPRG